MEETKPKTFRSVMGVVRHVATTIGGILIGFGYTDVETWTQIVTQGEALIGAVTFLGGVAASIWDKYKN